MLSITHNLEFCKTICTVLGVKAAGMDEENVWR